MNKDEYNSCMKKAMTGLHVTKEERKLLFCINAKLCSGKVADEAEATLVCTAPKLPKWAAKYADDTHDALSCAEKRSQSLANIDAIALKFKTGDVEGVAPLAAGILDNCLVCDYPGDFQDMAEAMNQAKDMAGRFYMVGEARELTRKLETIKDMLNPDNI